MQLLEASREGNIPVLAALLRGGVSPEVTSERNGAFPLLYASQNGRFSVVEILIDHEVDVNRGVSENGAFPLLLAAQNGHSDVVEALLIAGANVNAVNAVNGSFPLLLAAQNGHAEVVAALVAAGADVNAVDAVTGTFPLLLAAQNGHAGVVAALLAAGADVNAVDAVTGTFPLLLAAQNGHAGVVAALLAVGADANFKERNGAFPLLRAAQAGHLAVVTALLAAGAHANAVDDATGAFPLFLAAQNGHGEVIAALLAAGANPDQQQQITGVTAVEAAMSAAQTEAIQVFVTVLGVSLERLTTNAIPANKRNRKIFSRHGEVLPDQFVEGLLSGIALFDSWPVHHPIELKWERLNSDQQRRALKAFTATEFEAVEPTVGTPRDVRRTLLPFYPGVWLVEIAVELENGDFGVFTFLDMEESFVQLDGTSMPIHAVNARENEALELRDEETAAAYLKFFCCYTSGEFGIFRIVENFTGLSMSASEAEKQLHLVDHISPIVFKGQYDGAFRFGANVAYAGSVFLSEFEVEFTGMVQMTDDILLAHELNMPIHYFKRGLRLIAQP